MRFLIYTLGCKVNTYESEMMKEKLLANNFIYDEENPELIIVNTCSVTNNADHKSEKMVRHYKRNYKEALIVVCGCSSQNDASIYEEIGVDVLIGNRKKSEIVNLINNYLESKEKYKYIDNNRKLCFEDMQISKFTTHTRAFVKIEDGCDNFCSYCVIPFVRGSIRHKDFDLVLKEVKTLVDNNHQEIVFTGIHTGSYNSNGHDLTDLIHEVSKLENLKRIRISSIEITELNSKFLNELKNNPKICDHLHIPLQAGSNTILEKMNRKYDLEKFKKIINEIRKIRKNISITTDVIVGFPGETEELFNETMENVKEINFSKVHVFPYSIRKGTKASLMPDQVLENIKHERSKKLICLSNELENNYYKQFLNQEIEVLIEKNGDYSLGTTSNYLKVKINQKLLNNELVKVNLINLEGKLLIGEIVGQ